LLPTRHAVQIRKRPLYHNRLLLLLSLKFLSFPLLKCQKNCLCYAIFYLVHSTNNSLQMAHRLAILC
jgi:hypothetical protein